jgi:hypothetical protein
MFTDFLWSNLHPVYTMIVHCRFRFAPSLLYVCAFIASSLLIGVIAFPFIQSDRIHQLTRFLRSRLFGRSLPWSIMARGSPEWAPRSKRRTVAEGPCKPCAKHVQTERNGLHAPRGGYTMTSTACMEQAAPSLTPPRDYQSPKWAGARLAGLDKLFFGYLILRKPVFGPVLPRL